jgi:uncharacterized membrane protein
MQKAAAAQRNVPEKNEELTSMDGPESGAVASVTPPAITRFWEVDSWRGVAIITMVIFHLMFDLRNFGGVPVVLHEGFWFYFQRFTAISFISLSGVSVVLSYNRALFKSGSTDGLAWKIALRGLHILGIGLIFSLVMRVAGLPPIDFGVLHLIGTSIICSIPFLRNRWLTLAVAGLLYALSYLLKFMNVQAPVGVSWLVPLGIEPPGYYYSDYFPFPHWFAVFLIGVFVGTVFYAGGMRKLSLPNFGEIFPFTLLQFLGRHSLVIYVIHQPLLIGLLLLTGTITLG